MAIIMWCQESTDGSHNVVSTDSELQSECGFNRHWMAITVCCQERTDGSHNVVSTESGW